MSIFLRETYCMLIFLLEIDHTLIFSSWNLLHFINFSCNLLYVNIFLFVELFACWFFVRETCCMLIIFFVKHVACWIFFIAKLVVILVSPQETCCTLIFSFVKLNLSWYISPWNMFHVGFCLKNLLHADLLFVKNNVCCFSLRETYFRLIILCETCFINRKTCRIF